jgi:hypothetical protein
LVVPSDFTRVVASVRELSSVASQKKKSKKFEKKKKNFEKKSNLHPNRVDRAIYYSSPKSVRIGQFRQF